MGSINHTNSIVARNGTASSVVTMAAALSVARVRNSGAFASTMQARMGRVKSTSKPTGTGGRNTGGTTAKVFTEVQPSNTAPTRATAYNGSPRGNAGKTVSKQRQRKLADQQAQRNGTATDSDKAALSTQATSSTPLKANTTVTTPKKAYKKPFIPKPMGSSHRNDTDVGKNSSSSVAVAATDNTASSQHAGSPNEAHVRSKRAFGATLEHTKGVFPQPQAVTIYKNGTEYCSGSILADDLILTAAHCIANKDLSITQVGLGSTVKADQIKVGISSFTVHPKYEHQSLNALTQEEMDKIIDDYDDDYDDSYEEPTEVPKYKNKGLSKHDVALVKLEDGSMQKVLDEGLKLEYIKIESGKITKVLNKIRSICASSSLTEEQRIKKLSKEKFWLVGSGKTTQLNATEIITSDGETVRADNNYLPDVMLSGYLQLKPDCKKLENTLHFEFNVTSMEGGDKITWCSGDSGGTLYHKRGHRLAKPIGLVRGSDVITGQCVNAHSYRDERPDRFEVGHMEGTPLDKSVRQFITETTGGRMQHDVVKDAWKGVIPEQSHDENKHEKPVYSSRRNKSQ